MSVYWCQDSSVQSIIFFQSTDFLWTRITVPGGLPFGPNSRSFMSNVLWPSSMIRQRHCRRVAVK